MDITSVEAAKNVFQTAPFVGEILLTAKMMFWRVLQLARHIRARTRKLGVKRRSHWNAETITRDSVCFRAESVRLGNSLAFTATGLVLCQT